MFSISQEISNVIRKIAFATPRTTLPQLSAIQRTCSSAAASAETSDGNSGGTEEPPQTAEDKRRLEKDRTRVIPVETSIRYLKSAAFKETYGNQLVWEQYRRNHKGLFPPKKTRKTCIRKGVVSTGNPCPICRDEYLVLDHHNTELLHQFISPQTGEVLSYTKTGLCQKKHLELIVAVERARDFGLITFDVPFREYDYSEYYENALAGNKKAQA